jgi:maltooligosyltrehalose trehalohydrolase
MTALMLLAPGTPMLFMGQEFAASAPFYYFADHEPELALKIRRGRVEFLAQFRSIATKQTRTHIPDPDDAQTFERCKLDFAERETHRGMYELHRDLLRLRRTDAVFGAQEPRGVDGAVLDHEAFVLRFFGGEAAGDRLLFVNLGPDLNFNPAPEPLLAPPSGKLWSLIWSSEDWRYGGGGTPRPETKHNWCLPGHSAFAMTSVPARAGGDPAGRGDGVSEEEETRTEAIESWEEE